MLPAQEAMIRQLRDAALSKSEFSAPEIGATLEYAATGGLSRSSFASRVRSTAGEDKRECGHIFKPVSCLHRIRRPFACRFCTLETSFGAIQVRIRVQWYAENSKINLHGVYLRGLQGEIAYHSRTYGADPTCVICSRCWEPELHEGTDYYITNIAAGMCDVGDAEAIDPACWPARYRRFVDGSATAIEPIDALDPTERRQLEPLVEALVGFVSRTACELRNAADPRAAAFRILRGGTAGGLHPVADARFWDAPVSEGGLCTSLDQWRGAAALLQVDGRVGSKRAKETTTLAMLALEQQCHVVVHDDDYHDVGEVQDAFEEAGAANAMDLTMRVDADGSAVILDVDLPLPAQATATPEAVPAQLTRCLDAIAKLEGLQVSLESEALQRRARTCDAIVPLLSWLTTVHDGCADIVARALSPCTAESDTAPPRARDATQSASAASAASGPTMAAAASSGTGASPDPAALAPLQPLLSLFLFEHCLPRSTRSHLHDLYNLLLRRPSFRRPFSAAFVASYKEFGFGWATGVGSAKGTFAESIMQAIATPSISRAVVAQCFAGRLIAAVLHASLDTAMDSSAAAPEVTALASAVVIKHRRYAQLTPDLTVVVAVPGSAQAFVRDEIAVKEACRALGRLHGADPVLKREGDALAFTSDAGVQILETCLSATHALSRVLIAAASTSTTEDEVTACDDSVGFSAITAARSAVLNSLTSLIGTDAADAPRAMPTSELTLAEASQALEWTAEEVMARVALAATHGTSHPRSTGLVETSAPLSPEQQVLRQQMQMFINFGIRPPANLLEALERPAVTLEKKLEPMADVARFPATMPQIVCAEGPSTVAFAAGGRLEVDLPLASVDIDHSPVSFFTPLHNFLGVAARQFATHLAPRSASASASVSLLAGLKRSSSAHDTGSALIDHPIRALALARRVNRAEWVRNGDVVMTQALNFDSASPSAMLGDAARQCVAAGVASGAVAPRAAIALLFDRHGVLSFLLSQPTTAELSAERDAMKLQDDSHRKEAMHATDAFVLLAQLVSHAVPAAGRISRLADASAQGTGSSSSSSSSTGGVDRESAAAASIRAEMRDRLVHFLATGPSPRSKIAKIVSRGLAEVEDDMVVSVLAEIAETRPATDTVPEMMTLRDELWAEVDLLHPFFAAEKNDSAAREGWAEKRAVWRAAIASNDAKRAAWGGVTAVLADDSAPAAAVTRTASSGSTPGAAASAAAGAGAAAASHIPAGTLARFAAPLVPCPCPTLPDFARARALLHTPELGLAVRSVLSDAAGGVSARALPATLMAALHCLSLALMTLPRDVAHSTPAAPDTASEESALYVKGAAPALRGPGSGFLGQLDSAATPEAIQDFVHSLLRPAAGGAVWDTVATAEAGAEASAHSSTAAPADSGASGQALAGSAGPAGETAAPGAVVARAGGNVVQLLGSLLSGKLPEVAAESAASVVAGPTRAGTASPAVAAAAVDADAREAAAWCLRAMRELPFAELKRAATAVLAPLAADAEADAQSRLRQAAFRIAKKRALRAAMTQISSLTAAFFGDDAAAGGSSSSKHHHKERTKEKKGGRRGGKEAADSSVSLRLHESTDCARCAAVIPSEAVPLALTGFAAPLHVLCLADASQAVAGGSADAVAQDAAPEPPSSSSSSSSSTEAAAGLTLAEALIAASASCSPTPAASPASLPHAGANVASAGPGMPMLPPLPPSAVSAGDSSAARRGVAMSVAASSVGGTGSGFPVGPFGIGHARRKLAERTAGRFKTPAERCIIAATPAAYRTGIVPVAPLAGTARQPAFAEALRSVIGWGSGAGGTIGRSVALLVTDVHPCHASCAATIVSSDSDLPAFLAPLSGELCNTIVPLPAIPLHCPGHADSATDPAPEAEASSSTASSASASAVAAHEGRARMQAPLRELLLAMPPSVQQALARDAAVVSPFKAEASHPASGDAPQEAAPATMPASRATSDGRPSQASAMTRMLAAMRGRQQDSAEGAALPGAAPAAVSEHPLQATPSMHAMDAIAAAVLGHGYKFHAWKVSADTAAPKPPARETRRDVDVFAALAAAEGCIFTHPSVLQCGLIDAHGQALDSAASDGSGAVPASPMLRPASDSAAAAPVAFAAFAVPPARSVRALGSLLHSVWQTLAALSVSTPPGTEQAVDSRVSTTLGPLGKGVAAVAAAWSSDCATIDAIAEFLSSAVAAELLAPHTAGAEDSASAADASMAPPTASSRAASSSASVSTTVVSMDAVGGVGPANILTTRTRGLGLAMALRASLLLLAARDAACCGARGQSNEPLPPSPATAALLTLAALLTSDGDTARAACASATWYPGHTGALRSACTPAARAWTLTARLCRVAALPTADDSLSDASSLTTASEAVSVLCRSVNSAVLQRQLSSRLLYAGIIPLPSAFEKLHTRVLATMVKGVAGLAEADEGVEHMSGAESTWADITAVTAAAAAATAAAAASTEGTSQDAISDEDDEDDGDEDEDSDIADARVFAEMLGHGSGEDLEDSDDSEEEVISARGTSSASLAICLLTGTVLRAGQTHSSSPGECTLFARQFFGGQGAFLLLGDSQVVLMHGDSAAFYPSIYVDKFGECNPKQARSLPLRLSAARAARLANVVFRGGIPRTVARLRAGIPRVIRSAYF
jgi:hypothetical protein